MSGPKTPFIPGWLDDLGLTPAQFRVLCHIARRGQCFEGLEAFAHSCRMNRETIQAALTFLEMSMGLITKTPRPGQTSIYRLASQRKRGAKASEKEGLPTQRKAGARSPEGKEGLPLAESRGYKGSPSQGASSTIKQNDDAPY